MMYELRDKQTPYWFTNDEVARIQEFNQPFFKVDDLETMGCKSKHTRNGQAYQLLALSA